MTKQWLTRRAVRSPVSRFTTAPISSSVCRLPFISASALPSRTSSTALSAEAWLCGVSTIGNPAISIRMLLCYRLDPRARTDQDRRDQAEFRSLDRAAQRTLVAGMRDGRRRRRQRLAEVDQPLVFLVFAFHAHLRFPRASQLLLRRFVVALRGCFRAVAPRRRAGVTSRRLADVFDHRELLGGRLEPPHALVGKQPTDQRHQPLAIARLREQLGQASRSLARARSGR